MFRLRTGQQRQEPSGDQGMYRSSGSIIRWLYAMILMAGGLYAAYSFIGPMFTLEGEGVVRAPGLDVSVPFVATIKDVHVKAGQKVHSGTVLAVVSRANTDDVLRSLNEQWHAAAQLNHELQQRLAEEQVLVGPYAQRARQARERLQRTSGYRQYMTSLEMATIQRDDVEAQQSLAKVQSDLANLPGAIADNLIAMRELQEQQIIIANEWRHHMLLADKEGYIGANVMHAGSTVTPGQTILTVYDMSQVYVMWELPLFHWVRPREGQDVLITFGRTEVPGRIRRLLQVAKRQGGTTDQHERTGQMAEVEILTDDIMALPLHGYVNIKLKP